MEQRSPQSPKTIHTRKCSAISESVDQPDLEVVYSHLRACYFARVHRASCGGTAPTQSDKREPKHGERKGRMGTNGKEKLKGQMGRRKNGCPIVGGML